MSVIVVYEAVGEKYHGKHSPCLHTKASIHVQVPSMQTMTEMVL